MKSDRELFMEKYGDLWVIFSSYYKYVFTFSGKTNKGKTINVHVGRDVDTIYRFEVTYDLKKINNLDPYAGEVLDDQGNEIESFYDL